MPLDKKLINCNFIDHLWELGDSLEIKMADGGIQRSTFIVKHDGSIDFSINQKISVQEPGKVSFFSRQEK